MEDYSHEVYISHPTIDFTLLDRPSTSMISACDPVTPFGQGTTPCLPFSLFDGTEEPSRSNHLGVDHGSFVRDCQKNATRLDPSRGFVPLSTQSGVHDSFEPSTQLGRPDFHMWQKNEESAHHFSPRVGITNDELQRHFYPQNGFDTFAQADKIEQSNKVTRIPPTAVGFPKPVIGRSTNHSVWKEASLSIQENLGNQELSSQMPPSSNHFGSAGPFSVKSREVSHHPTVGNKSSFGAQYQHEAEGRYNLSQAGAVFDHGSVHNFLGHQKRLENTAQHTLAGSSMQPHSFTRTAKLPEPYSLHSQQLPQEILPSSYPKQLEEHRPEQGFWQQQPACFTKTSYSDLLHGPDTPPSQQLTTEEFENHDAHLSQQNTEAVVWAGSDEPLYNHGNANGLRLEQNLPVSQQRFGFGEVVSSCHSGSLKDQTWPLTTSCATGHVIPANIDCKWKPSVLHQAGKPVLGSLDLGSQLMTETKTSDLGPVTGWNNGLKTVNQSQVQFVTSRYSSGEALSKEQERNLSQAKAFSQSQQFFQELYFAQQKNLLSEPKQPMLRENSSLMYQSSSCPKSNLKKSVQQSFDSLTSVNNLAGYMLNTQGFPLECLPNSGQQHWLTPASFGSALWPISVDVATQHQAGAGESLQAPKSSRGIDFNTGSAYSIQNDALDISNRHLFPQQEYPLEGFEINQSQLFNPPKTSMRLEIRQDAGHVSAKQSSMALHDLQKYSGGTAISNENVHLLSMPACQLQGGWKGYSPTQVSSGVGSSGLQSLDLLRHQQRIQSQFALNGGPPLCNPPKLNVAIETGCPNVSSQLVLEGPPLMKINQLAEKHVDQNQSSVLAAPNFMQAPRLHAMEGVPDVMEENQGGRTESVEHQDAFVEIQQEGSQQQFNSCPANISLAHLKGNHSSSSLSPQHFRLGLGPSQDLQPSIDTNYGGRSHQQSLNGRASTLKSASKSLSSELSNRKHGSGKSGKEETELNKGTKLLMERTVVQNCVPPPSVHVQGSSQVSREIALSDTLLSANHASGAVRGATSFISANPNEFTHEHNKWQEHVHYRGKPSDDILLHISKVERGSSNRSTHQDVLSDLTGPSLANFSNSELPDPRAVAPSGSKKFLVCGPTLSGEDGGSTPVLQDPTLRNVSLRQTCRLPDVLESTGLTTALQTPVVEHPKSSSRDEYQFSGILESSAMVSNSTQELGVEKKQDIMQRAPNISTSIDKFRSEERPFQASSMQNIFKDQLGALKGTGFGNQARGFASNVLCSSTPGDGHRFSTSVDGCLTNCLQVRMPNQVSIRQERASSLNSDIGERHVVGRNFKKPPLKAASPTVFRPGIQLPSPEDPRQGQSSIGIEKIANIVSSPDQKTVLYYGQNSEEPMCTGIRSANQPAGNALSAATSDTLCRFDASQQYSVSISKPQNSREPVEALENSQLMGLGKPHGSVSKLASFANHSLTSCRSMHANDQSCKTFSPRPQLPLYKDTHVSLNEGQVHLGLGSSNLKEEVIMTPHQAPTLIAKSESCSSSLKFNNPAEVAPTSKKRKKQHPLLIPWHIAMVQPTIDLPSDRDAEMQWATASNRICGKDFSLTREDNGSSVFRARRRLTLTTESMQRLYSPLPDDLMHGATHAEKECGLYSLAKCVLEDTCQLIANTNNEAGLLDAGLSSLTMSSQCQFDGKGEDIELSNCVESFMERVKQLGMELARLDCSTSFVELQGKTQELEKLSIVNRLAKHHGIGFTMDSSDPLFIENNFECGAGAWKARPQKYVIPVPMPRTIPEGIRCLSL